MFCKSCGKEIDDKAVICPACGATTGTASPAGVTPAVKIENHLVGAILTTLCCCLPGGIVAIVYASKVNTLAAQGDIDGARKAANTAKNWILGSVIAGVVVQLVSIVINVLIQAAAVAANS